MLVHLKCPQCGAPLEMEESKGLVFCEYCGCKMINTNKKTAASPPPRAASPPPPPPPQNYPTAYVEVTGKKPRNKKRRIIVLVILVVYISFIVYIINAGSKINPASSSAASMPASAQQGPAVYTESQVVERGGPNEYIKRGNDFYLLAEQQDFARNGALLYYHNSAGAPPPILELQPGDELVIVNEGTFIENKELYGPYVDTGAYTIGMAVSENGFAPLRRLQNSSTILMGDAERVFSNAKLEDMLAKIQNDELFTINDAPFGPDTLVVANPDGYISREYGQAVALGFAIGTQYHQLSVKADVKVYRYLTYQHTQSEVTLAKNKGGYSITTGFCTAQTTPGIYYISRNNSAYFFMVPNPPATAGSLQGATSVSA